MYNAETKEYIVGQSEFAKIIGKSVPWVIDLINNGMPARRSGTKGPGSVQIDCPMAIKWLIDREKKKHQDANLDAASLRYKSAKADIAEVEAKEKLGEMRALSDYQIATTEAAVVIASQLEGLPSRMAAQLSTMNEPAAIRRALAEELRRIREAMHDRLRDWAVLATGRGADKPSTSQDSRPVG